MLETKNFHLVIQESVKTDSFDHLTEILSLLEDSDSLYEISGNEGSGGFPVVITYDSGHKTYGGLVLHNKTWQIHT